MTLHPPVKLEKIVILATFIALNVSLVHSQTIVDIKVDASAPTTVMPPIWRDHYECHLMDGYGGDPRIVGKHVLYITDPAFVPVTTELKPRFIRVSIGRMDNPPDTSYFSRDTNVLRNLRYEFYRGGNNMADADNLSNYNFSYIDSLIEVVKSVGAEPFITMDYMPFTLSRNNVPNYRVILWPFYQFWYMIQLPPRSTLGPYPTLCLPHAQRGRK